MGRLRRLTWYSKAGETAREHWSHQMPGWRGKLGLDYEGHTKEYEGDAKEYEGYAKEF